MNQNSINVDLQVYRCGWILETIFLKIQKLRPREMKGLAQGHKGNSICLFPYSCTLFQATLTFLLFGLFREGSILLSCQEAVYVGLCDGTGSCSLLHQNLPEFLEVNRQRRPPYSSTSYSGYLKIIDHISTHFPHLLF